MQTIGDHIIIKVDSDTKTDSGIILTNTDSNKATIHCDAEFRDLKAGTRILFNPTIGFNFRLGSEEVRHITSKEVLAILDE
jgi:co-chaperonin GroES (HSP10)